MHPDGTGISVAYDRTVIPLRSTTHGSDINIESVGAQHSTIHLEGNAKATVTGQFQGTGVYARVGDDVLVAIQWFGASSNIAVGRYDFAHGHGLNIGAHGSGTETFTLRSRITD